MMTFYGTNPCHVLELPMYKPNYSFEKRQKELAKKKKKEEKKQRKLEKQKKIVEETESSSPSEE